MRFSCRTVQSVQPRRLQSRPGAVSNGPPSGRLFPSATAFNLPAISATNAPVAQLDRAPDYESGGQEFESLRARH
jgi:hypothetical protein